MENNNGKGIFYGVIGVATLIVAIIGATFAYFSAQTASSQYVAGTAATASLAVYVERLTGYSVGEGVTSAENAKYTMVPQLDQGLSAAVRGVRTPVNDSAGKTPDDDDWTPTYTYGDPCIDATGSLVCQIYKITVHNTGSAAITVSGDIEFYATGAGAEVAIQNGVEPTPEAPNGAAPITGDNLMNHLKWARMKDPTGITDETTGLGTDYLYSEIDALGPNAEGVVPANAMPTELEDYTTGLYDTRANGTQTFYANYIGKDLDGEPGGDTVTSVNRFLYGRTVTVPALDSNITIGEETVKVTQDIRDTYKDLLGTNTNVVWEHGVYTDLIDPTDDLTLVTGSAVEGVTTTTVSANGSKTQGSYELNANGQEGEAKAYYIVVWISENLEEQNNVDFGTFAGQVTFTSSGGSGATSTFTTAYSS